MGLWNCRACRKPFTVRMGTIFESSHVALHIWLQAIYLICSSKKGISTRQIQRTFGGSMKTAWFLMHRIRAAMDDGSIEPFGSGGGVVEADETFIGQRAGSTAKHPRARMNTVLTAVDRETGRARSQVIENTSSWAVGPALQSFVSPNARLVTDEGRWYLRHGRDFASHETVNHSKGEYVRGDVTTNTVEGTFSVFKRGMRGIYQHCSTKHLHRYLAEFDFRYSYRVALGVDDKARADRTLDGFAGKRLTYETVSARRTRAEEIRVIW